MDWTTIAIAFISAMGAGLVPYITMRHKLTEQKRQLEQDQSVARDRQRDAAIMEAQRQETLQAERELARRERMEAEMSSIRTELREEIRELRTRLTEANTEILDLRRRLSDCEAKHGSQLAEAAALRSEIAALRAAYGLPVTERRPYAPEVSSS